MDRVPIICLRCGRNLGDDEKNAVYFLDCANDRLDRVTLVFLCEACHTAIVTSGATQYVVMREHIEEVRNDFIADGLIASAFGE